MMVQVQVQVQIQVQAQVQVQEPVQLWVQVRALERRGIFQSQESWRGLLFEHAACTEGHSCPWAWVWGVPPPAPRSPVAI